MHQYSATVRWERGDQLFSDRKYSRLHVWRFDGGIEVPGSSSPLVVREPLSSAAAVDPEEALIAALASCHMLFFLDFASRAGLVIDLYQDDAVGEMGKDDGGHDFVATIDLRPRIQFSDPQPQPEQIADLHHRSHEACFIARSLRSKVTVNGM